METQITKSRGIIETINKYLIIQDVPFEGRNTWTVFASTVDEAKEFVIQSNNSISKSDLTFDLLHHNIRGTKLKGIRKYSFY